MRNITNGPNQLLSTLAPTIVFPDIPHIKDKLRLFENGVEMQCDQLNQKVLAYFCFYLDYMNFAVSYNKKRRNFPNIRNFLNKFDEDNGLFPSQNSMVRQLRIKDDGYI